MTTTTRINIEKEIDGILVYVEAEIAYWCEYCPAEYDHGYEMFPSYLDTEAYITGSYIDSEIYLIKDSDEIELDPRKDKVLFQLAEQKIIEWIVENMTEEIDDSIAQDGADIAERHARA